MNHFIEYVFDIIYLRKKLIGLYINKNTRGNYII